MRDRGVTKNLLRLGILACATSIASVHAAAGDEGAAILDPALCRPAYPRVAMQRGEEGLVKMQFTVGANGKLVGSAIVKSSGHRELDQAALQAMIHCRFKPAYRNGKPVQAAFTMEYRWQLQALPEQ